MRGSLLQCSYVSSGSKAVISQIHLSTCLGRAKSFTEIGTAFTRGEPQFQP